MKERNGCRPDRVLRNIVNAISGTKPKPVEKKKFSDEAFAMMLKTETSEIAASDEGETVVPTGDTVPGKNGHKRFQTNKS